MTVRSLEAGPTGQQVGRHEAGDNTWVGRCRHHRLQLGPSALRSLSGPGLGCTTVEGYLWPPAVVVCY